MIILSDYIEMKKIWYDDDMTELKVVCSSDIITASAKTYVCDSLIDELIYEISQFLDGKNAEGYWMVGTYGDKYPACISLRFLHKDNLGHVLVEVYMELNDGGKDTEHNCCFYINTETGLLTRFRDELPRLKQKDSDVRVVLNDSGEI